MREGEKKEAYVPQYIYIYIYIIYIYIYNTNCIYIYIYIYIYITQIVLTNFVAADMLQYICTKIY
jgi:hypothetical protein